MKEIKKFMLTIPRRNINNFKKSFKNPRWPERMWSSSNFEYTLSFDDKNFHNWGDLLGSINSLLYKLENKDKDFICFDDGNKYGMRVNRLPNGKIWVGIYESNIRYLEEYLLNEDKFLQILLKSIEKFISDLSKIKIKEKSFNEFILKTKDLIEKLKNNAHKDKK